MHGWASEDLHQKLHVCIGNLDERKQALRLLADKDVAYVVDAATLAEMALLDAGEALTALPKLYVSAETQAVVLRTLENAKRDRSSGQAFERDGELGYVKYTEEQRSKNIAQLQGVADLMGRCCEVTPVYGPESVPAEIAKLLKTLPNEDRHVLLLAAEKGLRLFSLDFRLRNIAVHMGVQGVWPQPVLMHATHKGIVPHLNYTRAVSLMFMGGRGLISIGATELVYICFQGTAWLRLGMAKFMEHLRDPEADYKSAAAICRDFVESLIFSSGSRMGAVAELLTHIVEALIRHPASGGEPPKALAGFFRKVFVGEFSNYPYALVAETSRAQDSVNRTYFAKAIREGVNRAAGPQENRPIRVNVLMCGIVPILILADDNKDALMPDNWLHSSDAAPEDAL